MRRLIDIPLLICDFDGTLASLRVDWPSLKRRLAGVVQAMGGVWDDASGLDANLRRLRDEHGEPVFQRLCGMVAEAEVSGFDPATVHPGLRAILRARGGRPLAVVSANTRRALLEIFTHPVWPVYRPCVIGKEDVRRGKPDPEGLLRACRWFGIAPSRALYVGDAPGDRLAAETAGMVFMDVRFLETVAKVAGKGQAA
ncbi:MAG: hypothetical protein KatS3mg044_0609 [Rhodothermaceae bacterium]|nr:MAG: hypothetical protein KatS3mg044_0609 [Rhodothermaceae bacterium]